MTRTIARIPRPFLATGIAAGALSSVMGLCTTTAMAASGPLGMAVLAALS